MKGLLNADWYRPLFEHALCLFGREQLHAYYDDLSFEETRRTSDLSLTAAVETVLADLQK